jgi:hypothetical protein
MKNENKKKQKNKTKKNRNTNDQRSKKTNKQTDKQSRTCDLSVVVEVYTGPRLLGHVAVQVQQPDACIQLLEGLEVVLHLGMRKWRGNDDDDDNDDDNNNNNSSNNNNNNNNTQETNNETI